MWVSVRLSIALLLVALAGCDLSHSTRSAEAVMPGGLAGVAGDGGAAMEFVCEVDADCEVKDVGNCCGYYPRCVNVHFMPDPDAVRRACEASHSASICGWPEISRCACVDRRCRSMQGDHEV